MNTPPLALRLLILPVLAVSAWTQNLLPNPAFSQGAATPTGWQLAEGAGQWSPAAAPATGRVLQVTGRGQDQSVWRTDRLPLEPGGLYALRFRGRRVGEATGGTAIAGTSRINRDFPLDREWREYGFLFRQPDDAQSDFVRLGQWHVQGALEFDRVELWPVLASHREFPAPQAGATPWPLGQDETIRSAEYRFTLHLGGPAANLHRPLWRSTASFNSDRWVFSPGADLIYRFALPNRRLAQARVQVAINHHVAGTLELAASPDAQTWTPLATLDAATLTASADLPAPLLPAAVLFLRLRTPDPNTALQVNRCDFQARLEGPDPFEAEGATDFLEVHHTDPALAVNTFQLDTRRGQGEIRLELAATPRTSASLSGHATWDRTGAPTPETRSQPFTVQAGKAAPLALTLSVPQPGEHELQLRLVADNGRLLFAGQARARVNHLHDPRAGHPLAGSDSLSLWWCESGWKIARTSRPPHPSGPVRPVRVTAARAEFEAAQILLHPHQPGELTAVRTAPWRDPQGDRSPITLRLEELAYVQVTRPTDPTCEPDWYPDPLPPLELPRPLSPGVNLPLWLTFYIPPHAAPGLHQTELLLECQHHGQPETLRIPLQVQVYDFALPRESHLRSALGLGTHEINRYHKLTRQPDQIAVFERYLQNFAEHRISPYSFYDYAPIAVRFEGEGTNQRARVDFTRFDAAASRWLDGPPPADASARSAPPAGTPFNSFQLPLRGMGGGTFHSRHLGQLEGFTEGTPEHTRLFQDYLGQIERHLRTRGWLDKAFTYWFDEPDPKDYEFVVAGQQRLRAAAPGLRRLMTEQPEPELIGHVDIWCGLTPEWTPEKVRARRAAGEEVWWYICTAPKAPYLTSFIDHPGTELRLWPWQSWQYGVNGILIWATIYWHSPVAYPDSLQDPWEDPMSWVSGYGTPRGTRSPWGNGDGRFLYPPRRNPNTATNPALDGPINSIRWENLRDGMEDYEYFWLLDQQVRRLAATARDASPEPSLLAEARALLLVPHTVSQDLTQFTTDPRSLLEHRDRLARMIEQLQRQQ